MISGCICVVIFFYVSVNMRFRPGMRKGKKGNIHRSSTLYINNPGYVNLIYVCVSSSTSHNEYTASDLWMENRKKVNHSLIHPHIHKQSWICKSNLPVCEFFYVSQWIYGFGSENGGIKKEKKDTFICHPRTKTILDIRISSACAWPLCACVVL